MNLKKIKALTKQDKYDEALAECEKLLNANTVSIIDVLRVRAYIFSCRGDYIQAIKDRQEIIETGDGVLADYYLTAADALFGEQFEQSSKWFKKLLEISGRQKEVWFDSGSYFQIAFAEMKLRRYDEATQFLDKAVSIDAHVAMPLPSISGLWTASQLREEIAKHLLVKGKHVG